MATSTYKKDPMAHLTNAKRVDPLSPPAGVVPTRKVDILELNIEGKESSEHFATYKSVDGTDYTFRTHDKKGSPTPWRETLSLYLSVREMALGGSPFAVFDAFRLDIKDVTGKSVYPIQVTSIKSPLNLG